MRREAVVVYFKEYQPLIRQWGMVLNYVSFKRLLSNDGETGMSLSNWFNQIVMEILYIVEKEGLFQKKAL